jgi:ribosomal protein S3AE
MLIDIVEIAKEFDTSLESIHSGQEERVQELLTSMRSLLSSLHEMNDNVFSILNQMNAMGKGIMEDIAMAVKGISIHEEMKEILSGVMERLEEISRRSRQLYPLSDITSSSSFVKELEKYYTMESEYKIHAEHYGAGREAETPDRQQQSSEFGDNVELF